MVTPYSPATTPCILPATDLDRGFGGREVATDEGEAGSEVPRGRHPCSLACSAAVESETLGCGWEEIGDEEARVRGLYAESGAPDGEGGRGEARQSGVADGGAQGRPRVRQGAPRRTPPGRRGSGRARRSRWRLAWERSRGSTGATKRRSRH